MYRLPFVAASSTTGLKVQKTHVEYHQIKRVFVNIIEATYDNCGYDE